MQSRKKNGRRLIKPTQILILAFVSMILIGVALLMLPQAVKSEPISFLDALFTATSAVCVTGLTVVDTGTTFSPFGQTVIIFLIQAGGLGIMTLSTFFMFLIFGQCSLMDQDIIQETLTQGPIKNLKNFLRLTFIFTILVETIGAIILALRFLSDMSLPRAIFYGIFHSVSAFCNAGFALFSDSFIAYHDDWIVNIILMVLIIIGGLGFVVVLDMRHIRRHGKHFRFSIHTKLVLLMTATLIVFGGVSFWILEIKNALEHLPIASQILVSLFQSITARTAGFNTIDISGLSNTTLFLLIILMFVGASPGSCGGGIKTSTFGVLIAFLVSKFRNQTDVNLFKRRIPGEIISRTISVTIFSMLFIIVFTPVLLMSELGEVSHQASRGMFLEILFEVVSAFGTVGLSSGITGTLSSIGKIIVSMLMLIGRLGPLTIALAIASQEPAKYKYPEEHVMVG